MPVQFHSRRHFWFKHTCSYNIFHFSYVLVYFAVKNTHFSVISDSAVFNLSYVFVSIESFVSLHQPQNKLRSFSVNAQCQILLMDIFTLSVLCIFSRFSIPILQNMYESYLNLITSESIITHYDGYTFRKHSILNQSWSAIYIYYYKK